MWFGRSPVLKILDATAAAFSFPTLDNGYVYLAATRLSAFHSNSDWALVIEVFGHSPRAGLPDISIYAFASRLHNRNTPESYVSRTAYDRYIKQNPNNEFRSAYPIDEGPWQDDDDLDFVVAEEAVVGVRGAAIPLPLRNEYAAHGVELEDPQRIRTFELCRYLAETRRDAVLATEAERRVSIPPELNQILQLEEWHHPDVAGGERPSSTKSFRQLAQVLESGDPALYVPTESANTHWSNWPDGGLL